MNRVDLFYCINCETSFYGDNSKCPDCGSTKTLNCSNLNKSNEEDKNEPIQDYFRE